MQSLTCRVREQEVLYILRHLATLRAAPTATASSGSAGEPSASPPSALAAAAKASPRALLFAFYPLLLDIAFLQGATPSMWMFPDEHARLYDDGADSSKTVPNPMDETADTHARTNGHVRGDADTKDKDDQHNDETEADAGDGADLIEVTAKDLARRCLEIVGIELGLT